MGDTSGGIWGFPTEPPGAPSVPQVSDISDTSCRILWRPPLRDGDWPVTGYLVYVRTQADIMGYYVATVSGQECSHRVTNLSAGQRYKFSVRGKNVFGHGPPSLPTDWVTTYEDGSSSPRVSAKTSPVSSKSVSYADQKKSSDDCKMSRVTGTEHARRKPIGPGYSAMGYTSGDIRGFSTEYKSSSPGVSSKKSSVSSKSASHADKIKSSDGCKMSGITGTEHARRKPKGLGYSAMGDTSGGIWGFSTEDGSSFPGVSPETTPFYSKSPSRTDQMKSSDDCKMSCITGTEYAQRKTVRHSYSAMGDTIGDIWGFSKEDKSSSPGVSSKTSLVSSKSASHATKTSPVSSKSASQATKTSTVSSRSASHVTKTSPVSSKSASQATKTSPVSSKSDSHATKTSPVSSKSASQATKTSPVSSKSVSYATKTSPVSSKSASHATKTSPVSSKSASHASKTSPVSSKSASHATKTSPVSSKSASHATKTSPVSSKSASRATKASPVSSISVSSADQNKSYDDCKMSGITGTEHARRKPKGLGYSAMGDTSGDIWGFSKGLRSERMSTMPSINTTSTISPSVNTAAHVLNSSQSQFMSFPGAAYMDFAVLEANRTDHPFKMQKPKISCVKCDSCLVEWETKRLNVIGYYVEQCWSHDVGWLRCNSELIRVTSHRVTDLLTAKRYRFRIVAQDVMRNLIHGSASREITIGEPPGAPSVPQVSDISDTSCRILWRPPFRDGGWHVTDYLVYVYIQNNTMGYCVATVSGQEFSHRVTNLSAGQRYQFSVQGKNMIGLGPLSIRTDWVTTYGVDLLQKWGSLAMFETDSMKQVALNSITNSFRQGIDGIMGIIETTASVSDGLRYDTLSRTSKELRYYSHQAVVSLKEAFTKMEILNQEMNRRLEQLASEQGQKERDLMRSEGELFGMQREMDTIDKSLSDLRKELERINDQYNRSRCTMEDAQRDLDHKRDKQATVGGVGIVLMLIPVAGWIVGGAMLAVALTALEDRVKTAKGNLESAERMRDEQEQRVCSKEESITEYKQKLSKKNEDIDNMRRALYDIKASVKSLEENYYRQARVNTELTGYAGYLAGASDRAEILDDQLKYFYNLQAVLGPLRDLVQHLSSRPAIEYQHFWCNAHLNIGHKLMLMGQAEQQIKKLQVIDEHKKGLKAVMTTEEGRKNQQLVLNINTSVNHLFSAEAVADDKALLLSGDCSWEQFMIPAPVSICILGQLLVIAAKKDFPLRYHPPKGGFKHLRNQDSFRACLLQVSNEGRDAFFTANRNMDMIRSSLQLAPEHMQAVMHMLTRASNTEIEHTLHLPLRALEEIAVKCIYKGEEVEKKFEDVVDTIKELQGVCIAYKGQCESDREEKVVLSESLEAQIRTAEGEKENLQKQCEILDQSTKRAFDEFENAVKQVPSTGNLLAMRIVSRILSRFSSGVGKSSIKSSELSKVIDSGAGVQTDARSQMIEDLNRELYDISIKLIHTFTKSGNLVLPEEKSLRDVSVELYIRLNQVERIKGKSDGMKELKSLAAVGRKICKDITGAQKAMITKKNDDLDLARRILEFGEMTKERSSTFSRYVDKIDMQKPPCLSEWEPDEEVQENMVEEALQRQKRKTAAYCEQLKQAQKRCEEVSKKQEEMYENLQKSLRELAVCNDEELNIDQITEVLKKGLQAMSDLRVQWWKIKNFFHQIAAIVKSSLNTSLLQFVKYTKVNQDQAISGYTGSHLARDFMFQEVAKTLDLVNHVHDIAAVYVEVSNKFLMPIVNKLPEYLTSKGDLQQMQELDAQCEKVKGSIRNLLHKRKLKRKAFLDKRINTIQVGIHSQMNVKPIVNSRSHPSQQDNLITQNVLVDDWV